MSILWKETIPDKLEIIIIWPVNKYRGPAHEKCNINFTQKQSISLPFVFHNFNKYDSHKFFKNLVDEKKDKVKFDNDPKTNEEYM